MSVRGPARDTVVCAGSGWSMKARADGGEIVLDIATHGGRSGARTTFGAPGQGAVLTWGGHVVSGGPFFASGVTLPEVAQS